jgi:integrase
MPHSPKPFFRPCRNAWYVEIQKNQHRLGDHPPELPPPKKRNGRWDPPPGILDEFYRVMAERAKEPPPAAEPEGTGILYAVEKFLAWCQEHRAAETYEWYRWRLQLFADSLEDKALTVERLKHYHLDNLLTQHPGWAPGMKHGACRAVMRALRWAKKKGYVETNPLADYEKPSAGKRTLVISPDQFVEILALTPAGGFRDLLEVTWETGCRPQESLAVEARHVDLPNARWFFPPDESKGEQWPRVVYLTDKALAITRRLMEQHPTGPIFRNEDGAAFTPYAVNCAFCRLQVRMGLRRLKDLGVTVEAVPRFNRHRFADPAALARARAEHGRHLAARRKRLQALAGQHAPKYCLYNLRHSWLDRALKRGVDVLTCAILMGHRDPSTISKTYQHVSQSPEYLREAARRAAG